MSQTAAYPKKILAAINKIYGNSGMHFIQPFFRNYAVSNAMDMTPILGSPDYIRPDFKCGSSEVSMCDYDQLDMPLNSLIYCEPPDDINGERFFGYEKFYNWCIDREFDNYHVLIFDYIGREPPEFFKVMSLGHVALYAHESRKEIWGLG